MGVDKANASRPGDIRRALLASVETHPTDLITLVANEFKVSRQAVHRQVRRLIAEGQLIVEGHRRSTRYSAAATVYRHTLRVSPALEEDRVWAQFAQPVLHSQKPNILAICQHGFNEMLNNVIDHSEAQVVSLQIQLTRENIELLVSDDGIGIFNKIQTACHLENPEQAIFELSKGKLTTDPSRHSGEGIFFTSRVFDRFSILSGGLWFGHTREKTDWLMNDFKDRRRGTAVFMYIALNSEHTVQEAFDAYSTTQDGMTFDKTVVALDLAKSGPLVSRSQAKRVVSRLDRFREAVLDFQDVPEIGQAFADEIFRVYRSNNPGVVLTHIHANEAVEKMIHRVTTAEARAAVQGSAVGSILRRLLAQEDFISLSEDDKWTQLRSAIAAADASELPVVDSVEPSVRQTVMHFLIEMARNQSNRPTSRYGDVGVDPKSAEGQQMIRNEHRPGEAVLRLIHGRRATYQAARCRCRPCTAANAAYTAHLRTLRAHGRDPLGIRVPAVETGRRIRQLLQERVTRAEIAQALGLKRPRLEVHTGRGDWITLRTALRIKRLHRRWLSDGGD